MPAPQRNKQIVGAGLLLALLWSYWPTLGGIADRWWTDPKYSHGFLVPAFALWLLWYYGQSADNPNGWNLQPGSWWGLPFLLVGILGHAVGVYLYLDWFAEVSLLPALAGLCLCLGGWPLFRLAGPSIAFLAFMLPLPYRAEVGLAHPLQRVGTEVSTFFLQMIGLSAASEGNVIILDSGEIGVVEACSGLGMLVTFFALATAMAIVIKRPLLDKLVIFFSAVPLAVISNVLRITITAILTDTVGGPTANKFYHDYAGYFMIILALGLMWVELKILSHLLVEVPPEPEGAGLSFNPSAFS